MLVALPYYKKFFFSDIRHISIFKRHYWPAWGDSSEVWCEFGVQELVTLAGETCVAQSVRDKGPCWRWFQFFKWNLLPKLWLFLEVTVQSHIQLSSLVGCALVWFRTVPSWLWNVGPLIFYPCEEMLCPEPLLHTPKNPPDPWGELINPCQHNSGESSPIFEKCEVSQLNTQI